MDELLGRKVPYSAVAEQAVIGSMLIDPRCVPDVIEKVSAEDFYLKQNKDVFETIYQMFAYSRTIDPVTVVNEMKVRGVHDDNTESYLAEVMRLTPTAANVLEYAAIVRDRAMLRHLGEAADEINTMVYEGAGEADSVLEAAEQKIYLLRQGRNVGGLLPVSSVINSVFDTLAEYAKSGSRIPGLSTGLPDLDRMILGLNKSDFILIAARPGMGKTSIALNIALYVALVLKKTVAFFSLEMSREQLVTRLLSKAAMVPSQNLMTGQLTDSQWRSIAEAAQQMSASDIRIDDNPSITVSDMKAACRRIKDLGLVCIDYLQLMSSAGTKNPSWADNRQQIVSEISRMLKIMAKELNVPIICLSQLNRAVESRQDKRPLLSDLRESGSIEQDADAVIALYREGYYVKEAENPNLAEALILKNRRGSTGTVYLNWMAEYTSFTSYEANRDEDDY